MKRRDKVGSKAANLRRPKAAGRKRRVVAKTKSRPRSVVAGPQTQLSRLKEELGEAREQQRALAEVLRVISSSPGDLEPVFATMLTNAVRICDATFGNIYRWHDGALHLVAGHNTPPAFAEARRRSPLRGTPLTDRMVADKDRDSSGRLPRPLPATSIAAMRRLSRPSNLAACGRLLLFRC